MKSPVVNYRNLRLNNICTPQYSHLLLLLGWVGYFLMYTLTETLIPADSCHVIHCWLDDVIPFMEIFLIPYVLWYALVVGSLGYFALYDVESFKKLQIFIMLVQGVAMVVYILYPNRQDLRPEVFPRDNFFTDCIGFLYSFDTNTNVCPSCHVGYSLGIASVWLKKQDAAKWVKVSVVVLVALICASTCFIKQHSAVDFFAALPVCLIAELLLYWKSYWKPRLQKKKAA